MHDMYLAWHKPNKQEEEMLHTDEHNDCFNLNTLVTFEAQWLDIAY